MLANFRLVIFDADGTLRQTTVAGQPCPHGPDEWDLMPNVHATLRRIPWTDATSPRLGVASNQDHVGYGHLSAAQARDLLRDAVVAATGVAPPDTALQLCPHTLEIACDCRKPKPGMLLRIMAFYGVAPVATVFVGNSDTDRAAASAVDVRYISAADLFGWTI